MNDHQALRPLRAIGGWTVTLLCIDATFALLGAANALIELRLLGRIASDPSEPSLQTALRDAALRRALLHGGTLVATLVTAVVFLVWFHRAYGNLHIRGGVPRTTPGRATVSWFIPLGNLYLPYRAAQEIRVLSGEPTSSWVVFGWWAGWLLSALLGRLSAMALDEGALAQGTRLLGGASLVAAGSALFGAVFVARVSRAQA